MLLVPPNTFGRVSEAAQAEHAESLALSRVSAKATFIIGGQILGSHQEICLVYPQGNHIIVTQETPYLQIGETKYGKPILNRIISPTLNLSDAARSSLVSLDSTIRANISVGPPLDLAIYEAEHLALSQRLTLTADSPLYLGIKQG